MISNKKKKLRPIVHIELQKMDEISISIQKNAVSKKHKNYQYSCYTLYKCISKYERFKE